MLAGIPDDVFVGEPGFNGEIRTVGQLADAFVVNTTALRQSNNKLKTLCVAAERCKDTRK